ncbi:MAG: hypothetical protein R2761_27575 [Acidimicrobiales bacterium]
MTSTARSLNCTAAVAPALATGPRTTSARNGVSFGNGPRVAAALRNGVSFGNAPLR